MSTGEQDCLHRASKHAESVSVAWQGEGVYYPLLQPCNHATIYIESAPCESYSWAASISAWA